MKWSAARCTSCAVPDSDPSTLDQIRQCARRRPSAARRVAELPQGRHRLLGRSEPRAGPGPEPQRPSRPLGHDPARHHRSPRGRRRAAPQRGALPPSLRLATRTRCGSSIARRSASSPSTTRPIHKYGYSRAEFLRMTIDDIRPPEDKSPTTRHISRRARTATSRHRCGGTATKTARSSTWKSPPSTSRWTAARRN